MAGLGAQLARLRVAAVTGAVPPDLARWAVETITDLAPAADRVEARDLLLREAAARLGGSRWARAKRLQREIEALGATPGLRARAADDGVRDLVARALEIAPAPGFRQLLRVVTRTPVAVSLGRRAR